MTNDIKAKEMFEKLGYKYFEDWNSIKYIKLKSNEDLFETIVFYKEDKMFFKQTKHKAGDIILEELQAINQQVKELGWYE